MVAKEDKEKGLTGIREDARGFVGSRPLPLKDKTTKGRARIKFIIACGKNDENTGKLPTWRFCVGYDKVTDDLDKVKVGDLVKVSGWLTTEFLLDEYYKPVYDNWDHHRTRECLVLYKAEIVDYQKKPEVQPALMNS